MRVFGLVKWYNTIFSNILTLKALVSAGVGMIVQNAPAITAALAMVMLAHLLWYEIRIGHVLIFLKGH